MAALLLSTSLTAEGQGGNIFKKLFPPAEYNQRKDTTSKARKKPARGSRHLQKENEELKARIRNLEDEISSLRSDSLRIEYMEQETENIAVGLTPMDYSPEATDSLLSIWYLHRQASRNTEGTGYNLDSVHFSSNVPDSVIIRRLRKMNSFITLPYNETVRNYIILYSEKMPTKMGQIMGLSTYYFPIFEETFNQYGLPEELKYLAVIESALNPVAVSRANAKGMWQFMFNTAKNYGLEINSYVDERFDPFESADAAARYLQEAYSIFGDWSLAISSYNCGSGNVNKAIKRAGGRRDFWSIYPYLPKETRGYVPAMVGAMYAMTYYKECGIEPEPIHMPARVDTFNITRNLHFRQISEVIGLPIADLRDLNPQYYNDIVPGNSGEYVLRLPFNWTSTFTEMQDSIYRYKASEVFARIDVNNNPANVNNPRYGSGRSSSTYTTSWTTHKVRSGETLGGIARKYHCTVNQIKSWNNLRSTNIQIGQKLKIQQRGSSAAVSTASSTSSSGNSTSASGSITYTVRSGDTLTKIASRYPGVSANDIMKFNGIGEKIHPGMKIKIPTR